MPAFIITYDLRKKRQYGDLIKQLRDWGCISPLESVWFGNLNGPAPAIRDILCRCIDGDDGLLVVELKWGSDWATSKVNEHGGDWLKRNVKP